MHAKLIGGDPCAINIFDLVTITGKYGKTFGTPPP
jgi:hypothetical protein